VRVDRVAPGNQRAITGEGRFIKPVRLIAGLHRKLSEHGGGSNDGRSICINDSGRLRLSGRRRTTCITHDKVTDSDR